MSPTPKARAPPAASRTRNRAHSRGGAMAGGHVRLWRKLLDSRVFSDDWLWRLWCWCLMRACDAAHWKDGRQLLPGQFATGRNVAADQLKVSPSKAYRGLHTLQEWGLIRIGVNNHFTVVTICDWQTYRPDPDDERTTDEQRMNNQRTAGEQPADSLFDFLGNSVDSSSADVPAQELRERDKEREETSPPGPPPKEERETEKEKLVTLGRGDPGGNLDRPPEKRFVKPTLEEVAAYCRERKNVVDPAVWLDHYESNGWRVGRNPMKDWRAAVRTWERNVGGFTNGRHGKPSGPPESPEERTARLARLAREREESRQNTLPPEQVREILHRHKRGLKADGKDTTGLFPEP